MKETFIGVWKVPKGPSFRAQITQDKRTVRAGDWPTPREAAIARDRLLLYFGADPSRLQLADQSLSRGPASPIELRREARLTSKRARGTASRYLGVSRWPKSGSWSAYVMAQGKQHAVHGYATEEEAALAHDRLARHLHGSNALLNFPERTPLPASLETLRRENRVDRQRQRRRENRVDRQRQRRAPSPYVGVATGRGERRWTARVTVGGRAHCVCGCRTALAAAIAHDRMALHFYGQRAILNFPRRRLERASPEQLRKEQRALFKKLTSSKYWGVFFFFPPARDSRVPWRAQLKFGDRMRHLGSWETERAAALAVDRARLYYGIRTELLNFPGEAQRRGPADYKTLRREARDAFKRSTTSRFRGVYLCSTTGLWAASITHNRTVIHLGRFAREADAARAYDRAAERLLGPNAHLNFSKRSPEAIRAPGRPRSSTGTSTGRGTPR